MIEIDWFLLTKLPFKLSPEFWLQFGPGRNGVKFLKVPHIFPTAMSYGVSVWRKFNVMIGLEKAF